MRTWCYVWLWASESLSSPQAAVPGQVCLLQRGSGPSWVVPLCSGGDHVTLSVLAGRAGASVTSPDGPAESYWGKSSQLIRPVISWREQLLLQDGPGSCPCCHSAAHQRHLQQCLESWLPGVGGEGMLHLHPAVLLPLIICKQSVLGPALRSVLLF